MGKPLRRIEANCLVVASQCEEVNQVEQSKYAMVFHRSILALMNEQNDSYGIGDSYRSDRKEFGWLQLDIYIYFGDFEGRVYRLDAISGKEKWIRKPNEHPLTTITGSITIYENEIFIPLSSIEIVTAINKDYECCTFRGGIVAMNKFTGETKWKYHTVNEPIETGFNDADTKKWGPSGVPV